MPPHLYIHVPFCDGKCHYCGFYSVRAEPAQTAGYPAQIAAELDQALAASPALAGGPVRTVYFGGGTPALLGEPGLASLAAALAARLPLGGVEEWTVELNPASVTPGLLLALRRLGANRLSLGAQSFDDAVLARLGRRHTAGQTLRAVRLAQEAGFDDTGVDLIAGLPGVAPDAWRQDLARAAGLGLAHLSVYGLSLEPGTPFARQAEAGALKVPGDDEQLDALAAAEEVLAAAGFERYEISNYARPGRACRHNLGVWRGADFLGLGPAAASRAGRARWTNAPDLAGYAAALARGDEPPRARETLDAAEDAAERAVFALRLSEGLDLDAAAARNPALRARAGRWEAVLAGLSRQGLTERANARWRLTARGREVCDAVVRDLLGAA